jgi:hypothetical protein
VMQIPGIGEKFEDNDLFVSIIKKIESQE